MRDVGASLTVSLPGAYTGKVKGRMTVIRLTAKRQATLPKRLCEQMNLRPGDALVVDEEVVEGRRVWRLSPADRLETPWFARLKRYGRGKRHDLGSVRSSIKQARRDGRI
jgi:bifunctional DNA-binding transcriptional regulator/antitoxin component of YhaV-PrlF toxin-antitoxin module